MSSDGSHSGYNWITTDEAVSKESYVAVSQ